MPAMLAPLQKHRAKRPGRLIQRRVDSPGTRAVGAGPQAADGALEQVAAQWEERFFLIVDRLGAEIEPLQGLPAGRGILAIQERLGQFAQPAGSLHQPGAQIAHSPVARQGNEAFL